MASLSVQGPAGSVYSGSNDNRCTLIRKINIMAFASYGLALGKFNSGQYDGFVIGVLPGSSDSLQFNSRARAGAKALYTLSQPVRHRSLRDSRYSKLYDSQGSTSTGGGTGNRPFAAIETYGGSFNIHHNTKSTSARLSSLEKS